MSENTKSTTTGHAVGLPVEREVRRLGDGSRIDLVRYAGTYGGYTVATPAPTLRARRRWRLLDSWRPKPCQACHERKCKPNCDGIPF